MGEGLGGLESSLQNQEMEPGGRNLSPFKPACYKVFLCKSCPLTGTSKQLCRGRCEVVLGVCPSACAPKVQRNPTGLSHKCLPHGLHSCISVRIWLSDIVLVQEPVLFAKQTSKRFVLVEQQHEQARPNPSMDGCQTWAHLYKHFGDMK